MISLKAKALIIAGTLILGSVSAPVFAAATSNSVSTNTNVSINNNTSPGFFNIGIDLEAFFENLFNRRFETTLEGEQEVPGPGDPDGTGEAKIKIKSDQNQLCIDMEVENLDPTTAAHIHFAPKGAAGAIFIPLPTPDSEGKVDGCINADHEKLEKIKDHPEEYYVNVHTTAYPDGAIRGQLAD